MMRITSLRSFARLLKRPFAASFTTSGTGLAIAPPERRDLSRDVSHYAAYVPPQTLAAEVFEQRIAALSTALTSSVQRADEAALLALQTSELSISGVRVFDETVATIGRAKNEARSLAELLNLIDGITSRMQLLAWNAGAEASWAGEHNAAFAKLASDARLLAEDGASVARIARQHVNATVGHAETGAARAAEVSTTFADVVRSLEQVRLTLSAGPDAPVPAIGVAPSAGGTLA